MARESTYAESALLALVASAGVWLMLVATNVIAVPNEDIHVPRWVLFVSGMVLVLPGVAHRFPRHSHVPRYLITLMLFCFSAVGIACGATGQAEDFSGGLPFVPHEWNVWIARAVFVSGGVLLGACGVACACGHGTIFGESEHENQTGSDEID